MSVPTTETTERIKACVRLRVEGTSWANIATRYGYANEDTACHTLTQEHPELWRAEYEQARALYLDEVEGEALLTQRQLMRPKRAGGEDRDERIMQSAAHSLLNHSAKLRAQKVEVRGTLDVMAGLYAAADNAGMVEDEPTGEHDG